MEILEKDFGFIAEREVINNFKNEVKGEMKELDENLDLKEEAIVSSTSSDEGE